MKLETLVENLQSLELIWEFITKFEISELIENISKAINMDVYAVANLPMGGYSKGKSSGSYFYVIKDLKENLRYYKWFGNKLLEDRSKEVYLNLIRYRLFPHPEYLKNACDKDHDQYFDPRIIQCDENEVFVDCGGFIGDTVESFIENFKSYKRIYTYEPANENIVKAKDALQNYENIMFRPYGVGKSEGKISFVESGSSSSYLGTVEGADVQEIKITSLDVDILEPVSFIKMDIEGYEIDAIIGAKNHIINDQPKLTICLYYLVSDLWEIPKLIDSMNPNYQFYLRHYRDDQNWETVLYAIPKKINNQSTSMNLNERKNVYVMNGDKGYWVNQQLTKDCGIIPFLLIKRYDWTAKRSSSYPLSCK